VTAEFFKREANQWIDVEVCKKTWEERLFGLIELGDGFVACKGGTGTLVELAVVWEMMNKSVMEAKPFVALGDFWQPILERVRKLEQGPGASTAGRVWGEANGNLVQSGKGVNQAVEFLSEKLKSKRK
jgi:predicted Rossmann-fold nucleotide-binding protein